MYTVYILYGCATLHGVYVEGRGLQPVSNRWLLKLRYEACVCVRKSKPLSTPHPVMHSLRTSRRSMVWSVPDSRAKPISGFEAEVDCASGAIRVSLILCNLRILLQIYNVSELHIQNPSTIAFVANAQHCGGHCEAQRVGH